MMQPRSPQTASTEATAPAVMMEPSRRKRKRPEPVARRAVQRTTSESETEHDDEHRHETNQHEPPTAPRGPFRGKCLYQSRKCENERALKRNGKPHNLCDEHRNKQNQHQRKFDAKKYTRKKQRTGSDSDERSDAAEQLHDDERTAETSTDKPSPASSGKRATAVAKKAKRRKAAPQPAPGSLPETNVHAIGSSEVDHSRPVLLPSYPVDARRLDVRRPPHLQMAGTSPPSNFSFPHMHQVRSPHVAYPHGSGHERRSPQYAINVEGVAVPAYPPPATPVDRTGSFLASPHGSTALYPFMRPPPASRSRSFDSGVTRISPMGGAAPGSTGYVPFDRQRQLEQDQRPRTPPDHPTAATVGRPDKLPSLQQLPLGQLARSAAHHSPYAQSYLMERSSTQAYSRQSPPGQHLAGAFGLPRPPAPASNLLPSLAPLRGPGSHQSRASPPPPSHLEHRSYTQRDHDQRQYPY